MESFEFFFKAIKLKVAHPYQADKSCWVQFVFFYEPDFWENEIEENVF